MKKCNVDILEAQWQFKYKLAENYFDTYGDLKIPRNYKVNNVNLGIWLNHQRANYRENGLDREKIIKLERLKIDWGLSCDEIWKVGYNHALDYYNLYNDLNVPFNYVCEDGYNLGIWIINQRRRLRDGHKKDLLNEIHMVWKEPLSDDIRWSNGYNHAKEYYDEFHNLLVPYKYISKDGYKLGCWIHNLRHRRDKLSKEKLELLKGLDFVWSVIVK